MNLENLEKIHKASIELLETVGFEIKDEEVLNIFVKDGVRVEGQRVYFTEEQINAYLEKAPNEFTLYARNPKYDMHIGGDSINNVAGYGCPKIREYNGNIRNATFDDYLKFLELVQSSDEFKINGGVLVHPTDINMDLSNTIMIYSAIMKSDKCIFTIASDYQNYKQIIDLVAISVGGMDNLVQKPQMMTVINTLSPMKLDSEALQRIKLCCSINQPILITSAPMAGASGPITLAGNIAMANAEIIAGIAVIQAIKPGLPIIYGSAAMSSDMKSGGSAIGSPEYGMQAQYFSALGKRYNVPVRVGGALSDANGLTVQAGYESMMCLLATYQAKANFILHSAGVLDSYSCMSYEKFISDLEIIRMAKFFCDDIQVNEKTLALNVIKEICENDTAFLGHKHTAKNCRKVPYKPVISQRGKLTLDDTPNNLILNSINKEMDRLISLYEKPQMEESIKKQLREYMENLNIESSVLDRV